MQLIVVIVAVTLVNMNIPCVYIRLRVKVCMYVRKLFFQPIFFAAKKNNNFNGIEFKQRSVVFEKLSKAKNYSINSEAVL